MTSDNTPPRRRGVAGRTVQDYIDETPLWADATPVGHAPITNMQWFIWWLAAAGKFFEGMVVFTTGVALPLMAKEFALGHREGRRRRCLVVRHPDRGRDAWRAGRSLWPKADVHCRDGVLFGIFTVLLTLSSSYLVVVA